MTRKSRFFVRSVKLAATTALIGPILSCGATALAQENESPAPAGASVADLAGVWQGRLRLGPDVKGPLVIFREKDEWSAEITGHATTDRIENGTLVFDFGDLVGTLKTEPPRSSGAKGWWYQPFDVPMGKNVTPYPFATPVDIKPAGRNRWRAEIEPYEFQMTLYFAIGDESNGTAPVVVRNPERNFGLFLNAKRVTLSGDKFQFLDSDKNVTAGGIYNPNKDILSFEVHSQGGTFDLKRVKPGEPTPFYPRGFPTTSYQYTPPPALDDGWQVSTLEREGVTQAEIEKFIQMIIDMPQNSVHREDIHAVLIARNGKLVLEEYFHGFHRNSLHDTRSAAKSFTATLAGAVIQRGGSDFGVDTPVYSAMNGGAFLPDLDPRKKAMTVEHLLTMSTGIYCDDNDSDAPANESVVFRTKEDWYAAMLDAPMESAPGTNTVYCSLAPNLLGGVIAAKTAKSLTDLFRDLVAEPLDMAQYAMNLQPTGEPYMGGGVFVEPRDFLKFAQLMLNGGKWRGRRILSEEWAERASSPLREMWDLQYGYLWWVRDVPYKGRTTRVYYAAGNGGQTSLAVPELNLAVAFFAGNYSDGAPSHALQEEYVPEHVLPAIR